MNKEIKIEIPDGYYDYTVEQTENGAVVKFIKREETLEDILDNHCSWSRIGTGEDVAFPYIGYEKLKPTKQRLELIAQYIAVADYLNGDWRAENYPNNSKFSIFWNIANNKFAITSTYCCLESLVYFRYRETAEKVIDLFGEERLKIIFGIK